MENCGRLCGSMDARPLTSATGMEDAACNLARIQRIR